MTAEPEKAYLEVTQEAGRDFLMRGIQGEIVMLNFLRFREEADYSEFPDLRPESPITGAEAYRLYAEHTVPFLQASGGDVQFVGAGGHYLIGPTDERWDQVLLVRHKSVQTFMSFASNKDFLAGMGHRLAALADSRLLPLIPQE